MKKVTFLLFISIISSIGNLSAQYIPKFTTWYQDTIKNKNPWEAGCIIIGTNLSVWSVDKFAIKADYAQISGSTIRDNFKRGFVWDNDKFLTNLFMHPYHGGLYYNAARANGMNYWQCIPFTIGGSLTWELFMETEPPSINDVFTTSIGGLILGEITHRISTAIVNESAHGLRRVGLETAGFLLTPTASITRMINGDMFRSKRRKYHQDYPKYPLYLQGGIGSCFNADETSLFKGIFSTTLDLQLSYNDPFEIEECKPFDYFRLNTTLKLLSNQPTISRVNAIALMWGKNYRPYKNHKMLIGIFQNFDYFDSDTLFSYSTKTPYKISTAASIGSGLLYSFTNDVQTITADIGIHLNGILMGGSFTDNYRFLNRNYNLGSGFGSKIYSQIRFTNVGSFYLGLDFIQIYTWKGYPPGYIDPNEVTAHNFSAQGDKGFSNLIIINPRMELYINKHTSFNIDLFTHIRNTHYTYYDDVRYHTFEVKSSLVYKY